MTDYVPSPCYVSAVCPGRQRKEVAVGAQQATCGLLLAANEQDTAPDHDAGAAVRCCALRSFTVGAPSGDLASYGLLYSQMLFCADLVRLIFAPSTLVYGLLPLC